MPKVLYIGVGFAPFYHGSGIVYQQGIMEAVAGERWDVVCYPALRYDLWGRPRLKYWKRNGIRYLELLNSPNNREPYNYRSSPFGHCSNSVIEALTEKVLTEEKPDVVHIISLQMHCGSIVHLAKKRGIPVVKMITDYWEFCPLSRLYYKNQTLCEDFDEGRRCVDCIAASRRSNIGLADKLMYSFLPPCSYSLLEYPLDRLRKIRKAIFKRNGRVNSAPTIPLTTPYAAKDYADRRKRLTEVLNSADVIQVESKFAKDKLVKLGVRSDIIRLVSTTRQYFDSIHPNGRQKPQYPIRFGYLGGINEHKGVFVLLEAFSRIDQTKAQLLIFGGGDKNKLNAYRHLNIHYGGSYLFRNINKILSQIDVGVVPSIWEEILCVAGVEFLQAGIPVLATNKGGTSEWLKDKVNGFFFNCGDSSDLSDKMNQFIQNPDLIEALHGRITRWKPFRTHVREILDIYGELTGK